MNSRRLELDPLLSPPLQQVHLSVVYLVHLLVDLRLNSPSLLFFHLGHLLA